MGINTFRRCGSERRVVDLRVADLKVGHYTGCRVRSFGFAGLRRLPYNRDSITESARCPKL
jgi:hypothetical protein